MTMTTTQGILTIAAVVLGTMVTRFLPFLIFPEGKEPPEFILYLGKVLPLCSHRSSGHLLSERCTGKRNIWNTGIFGDCIYRTPSQMEKEHIAQYRRRNCILYAAGAVCMYQANNSPARKSIAT